MSLHTRGARPLVQKNGIVKTSVHLPEGLWHRAKVRALEERRDLRDLIIEGLELVLERKRKEG